MPAACLLPTVLHQIVLIRETLYWSYSIDRRWKIFFGHKDVPFHFLIEYQIVSTKGSHFEVSICQFNDKIFVWQIGIIFT